MSWRSSTTADHPRRGWRSLVNALQDPARSEFAFVPHQYYSREQLEENVSLNSADDASASTPRDATPSNVSKYTTKDQEVPSHQVNWFFLLHLFAVASAVMCCIWASLFPLSPVRLYNMQVDIFSMNHAHTTFYFMPCLALGSIVGASFAGVLGDRIGRAGTLELAAVPYLLGWVLITLTHQELLVILGRFLLGASAGLIATVAPIYLAEVTAASTRGRVWCFQALAACVSALLYVSLGGLFIHLSRNYSGFNLAEWRLLGIASLFPGFLLLLFMHRLPDSPTWLLHKHQDPDAAFSVMKRLFGGDSHVAEFNINALIHAKELSTSERSHHGAFFRPLLLCLLLFALKSVCSFFLQPTLLPTPDTNDTFAFAIFGIGLEVDPIALLLVMSFIWVAASIGAFACFFLIDVRGRLVALQSGCYITIAACCFLLLNVYRSRDIQLESTDRNSAAVLLAAAAHQLGLGIVPIVLATELFAVRQRLSAFSILVVTDQVVRYLLAQSFVPLVQRYFSTTQVFATSVTLVLLCNLAALVTSWMSIPETSKLSLQEIEAVLCGWRPATPQWASSSKVRLGKSVLDYGT